MRKAYVIIIAYILLLSGFAQVTTFTPNISTNKTMNTPYVAGFKINQATLPFEMKVLFEDEYAYYTVSGGKFNYLLNTLENYYGFTVDAASNGTTYDSDSIKSYWLVIMPHPDNGNISLAKQEALINYLNTTRGFMWVLGESSYFGVNKALLDNITKPFYAEIADDQVKDDTNNAYGNYNPLVHVYANTSIAKYLSNNGSYTLEQASTTHVLMTDLSVNGTKVVFYRIGIGDNDTYTVSGSVSDGDITYSAMVHILNSDAYLFLAGSTKMFASGYYYYDNEKFIGNLIEYGLSRDLKISSYAVPSGDVLAGQIIYINFTVENTKDSAIDNVHVGIEYSGAMELLNASNDVNIGTLNAGESKNITFAFRVTGTSDAYVELKTWSDTEGIIGYQLRRTFRTLGLVVSASISPYYVVLSNFQTTKLTINVTNPGENPNATDVNVSITLPEGLSADQTSFHFDEIANGTSVVMEVTINASNSEPGRKEIQVSISSDNLGTAGATVVFTVYQKPFAIFDEGHYQYYRITQSYSSGSLKNLSQLVGNYYEIYINNGTLDANLLGNASMLIMAIPGVETPNKYDPSTWYVPKPLTSEEIENVINFIQGGGKAIILATWYRYILDNTLHGLNNITTTFGIYLQDAEIMDDTSNAGKSYYPILTNLQPHPISADVTEVIAASSTYMLISGDAKAVLRGNPTSYGVNNESNGYTGTPTGVNGSDIIAVATAESSSGGRLVVFGSGAIVADRYFGNNSKFIDNAVKWLVGDTEEPSITLTKEDIVENETVVGVKIKIEVTDNLAIRTVNITVNGSSVFLATDLTTARFTKEIEINETGTWIVSVTAVDWEGNTKTEQITVELNITQPQPPPTNQTGGTNQTTGGGGGGGPTIPTNLVIFGIVVVVAVVAAVVYLFKFKKEA